MAESQSPVPPWLLDQVLARSPSAGEALRSARGPHADDRVEAQPVLPQPVPPKGSPVRCGSSPPVRCGSSPFSPLRSAAGTSGGGRARDSGVGGGGGGSGGGVDGGDAVGSGGCRLPHSPYRPKPASRRGYSSPTVAASRPARASPADADSPISESPLAGDLHSGFGCFAAPYHATAAHDALGFPLLSHSAPPSVRGREPPGCEQSPEDLRSAHATHGSRVGAAERWAVDLVDEMKGNLQEMKGNLQVVGSNLADTWAKVQGRLGKGKHPPLDPPRGKGREPSLPPQPPPQPAGAAPPRVPVPRVPVPRVPVRKVPVPRVARLDLSRVRDGGGTADASGAPQPHWASSSVDGSPAPSARSVCSADEALGRRPPVWEGLIARLNLGDGHRGGLRRDCGEDDASRSADSGERGQSRGQSQCKHRAGADEVKKQAVEGEWRRVLGIEQGNPPTQGPPPTRTGHPPTGHPPIGHPPRELASPHASPHGSTTPLDVSNPKLRKLISQGVPSHYRGLVWKRLLLRALAVRGGGALRAAHDDPTYYATLLSRRGAASHRHVSRLLPHPTPPNPHPTPPYPHPTPTLPPP